MDIRTAYQIAWRYARLRLQVERLWERASYEEYLEMSSVPYEDREQFVEKYHPEGLITAAGHEAVQLQKRIAELIPVKPSDAMITIAQGCLFQRNYRPSWTPLKFGLWKNRQQRIELAIAARRHQRKHRRGKVD